ncbi:diguanylate cyclase (GGDEF)-like protein [Halanaerobium saccharolyticum]|uniref:Diguanylate cyclase (GGDEF)-like protein n=1 Tax=Halanaerobium saccharolyticum TaxID=43595 RepID=A0A4R6M263_9FIRM|nr:diguanylate cyclase [Halanaerobium saccharolyticum]TDO95244.1 diguanylate cyclase (GGDEF)-like protein [Halanaerobium saccharolyticum]
MSRKSLTFIFLIFIIFLMYSISTSAQSEPVALDLRNSNLSENIINLDGNWEFYWQELLQPGEFNQQSETEFVELPAAWNGYNLDGESLSGNGYATYRKTLNLKAGEQYGLKIPRIFTSYKLWLNGQQLASAGMVAESRAESAPQYLPQTVFFEAAAETELVIQVSNFSHRSGGILESIKISDKDNILALNNKNLAYDIFLFGSILIMGVYHLILFLKRRNEYSLLYFGLFCVLVSFRTILVGEIYFIQVLSDFSWEIAHKLQTLSFYLGVLVITGFFYEVFNSFFSEKLLKVFTLAIIPFILVVLFTPARIFTLVNPAFQLLTLIIICYLLFIFYKVFKTDIIQKKNLTSLYIMIGALALFITVLNDIGFLSILRADQKLFNDLFVVGNLSSLGFLIFIFTDSLALAVKYSDTFVENEKLAGELLELNKNLENKVRARTSELFESNAKIREQKKDLEKANSSLENLANKDALTMIWNRRYFDQQFTLEWRRALRSQTSLSLLFIDIDDFKIYNDQFGHDAGDICLQKVAGAITQSVKRAGELAARFGGEEFVVLLPEIESKKVKAAAELIRENIGKLQLSSPLTGSVTASIGAASIVPAAEMKENELIIAADQAMYLAKKAGKNLIEVYDKNKKEQYIKTSSI